MTQELRKLAEAAKGWLIQPVIVQETSDDILKLGSTSEDGEFYELIEIDCENYDQPSRPLAEFIAAANPAAILALLDRVEKAEKDAARLDWLQEQSYKAPHLGWVARESTTGRGYRLHQDAEGAVLVRVAIDSAMEASK